MPRPDAAGVWATVLAYGRLIRFSHTIFGLPFALASTALAHAYAVEHDLPGLTLGRFCWIVVAFTAARSGAMGFNRVVDREIDARNPRTRDRELPRGIISPKAAASLTSVAIGMFLIASFALGTLPGLLSLPCLAVILSYSYFKRFSWASHLVLGVALSLAPGGAWVAVTGGLAGWPTPLALMLAVATWVAGFDVLYSLSDESFDRRHGLHSIPVRFGTVGALKLSSWLHVGTVACLVILHLVADLGAWHLLGVVGVAAILVVEHAIVKPHDLSRIGKAFFDLNGYVSIVYLLCTVFDLL